MKLPVKRLDPGAILPEYKTPGAAAFDLASLESRTLAPGEVYKFRTGLVFCIPPGHFMLIASRSSNAPKHGITMANGIGVIDSDYCGPNDELHICLQNITNLPVTIEAGDRVAQGIILPSPQHQVIEVSKTGSVDRGGFGSTGR